MIRAIANKKLELSKEESSYYDDLEKVFGADAFRGLFASDKNGKITAITPSPSQPTAMVLIFFFLNVMMNQRLREFEKTMEKVAILEKEIGELKNKVK